MNTMIPGCITNFLKPRSPPNDGSHPPLSPLPNFTFPEFSFPPHPTQPSTPSGFGPSPPPSFPSHSNNRNAPQQQLRLDLSDTAFLSPDSRPPPQALTPCTPSLTRLKEYGFPGPLSPLPPSPLAGTPLSPLLGTPRLGDGGASENEYPFPQVAAHAPRGGPGTKRPSLNRSASAFSRPPPSALGIGPGRRGSLPPPPPQRAERRLYPRPASPPSPESPTKRRYPNLRLDLHRSETPPSPPASPPTAFKGPVPLLTPPSSVRLKGVLGSDVLCASPEADEAFSASFPAPAPAPFTPTASTPSPAHLLQNSVHSSLASAYALGDELGSGGFGFVISATRRSDSLACAVKFIYRDRVRRDGWIKDPQLGTVPLEISVLRFIRHDGVVSFVDYFEDSTYFYLVMELHGTPWPGKTPSSPGLLGGSMPIPSPLASLSPPAMPPMGRRSSMDLFECIETHKLFDEDTARYIFRQVVEAVAHLARNGIYHRDLKDENIVIDEHFNVKLIDFGSAVMHDCRRPPPICQSFYGTIQFAAPEILRGLPYEPGPAEVWALGVLLSTLVTGESIFPDHHHAMHGHIGTLRTPVGQLCWDLMTSCFAIDPARRPTVEQLRKHQWLRLHRRSTRP